jgi:hypothetical protein
MAKIRFTSIVSEIRGALRGDVFKGYKQGYSLQNKARPPFSNTQKQSDTRSLLVYLTGLYGQQSADVQALWAIYGSALIPPISGQNAFTKLNLPILASPGTGYTVNLSPPPEPVVVLPPSELIYWPNFNGTHQIFWIPPADLDTACSLWSARLPGFSLLNRERWGYVGASLNSSPTLLIANPFTINVPVVIRARTITPYGTVSAFTPRVRIYPRVLNYLDRCDELSADFSGNYTTLALSSVKIEGDYSYFMRFSLVADIEFLYAFDPEQDWSIYKTLNFILKSSRALPTTGTAVLYIQSKRNGSTIPVVYPLVIPLNAWNYYSIPLPMVSAAPLTFNIERVVGISFQITDGYPEGEVTDIYLDHVHLEEGVSDYVPPPPAP